MNSATLAGWFTKTDLLPHAYCLTWQPGLMALHAVSDLVIALAYFSIPITLLFFARRREDLQFRWVFVLFSVFILACGATHAMGLWTLWVPDYLAAGLVKAVTAAASVGTAIILYPLIPKALALPGPQQWAAVHGSLRAEVAERREAEAEVRRLNAELEQRVLARTAELEEANRQLLASNAKLSQNQQLLRSIIDNSTAVIYLKDLQGRYLLINQRYAELFHISPEAVVGRTDYDIFPPERAEAFRAFDRQVLSAGGALQAEEVAPQDDGLHTYISLKYPLCDAAGQPYAVCGISTDITASKVAENERHARHLAEAANQAKSEFLSNMSHELRTPLNAILGYTQLLQRDPELNPQQSRGLNTIWQSGQYLLTLINDLLDLAKIEAGKLELYPAPLSLAAFLPMVADIIRVRAEEKSLLFAYQAAPDLPRTVLADEKRLRQVLLNLLGNAVKFTDRGQVSLRVEALAGSAGQARLRFEVADSGVGMSAEQLAAIFQPFVQVGEARRRAAGTGLGLSISCRLVRLMGSELEVASQPGGGSRFWFELVLPLADVELPGPAVEHYACGYLGPRRRVLLVDDVPGNRALLATLLDKLGFVLGQAGNGQEALEEAQRATPDLVLTDIVMPVMGGLEMIRRLRRLPGLAALPIIAASASASHEEQLACLTAGAQHFLSKPIEQECLLQKIGELLGLTWTYPVAALPPAVPPQVAAEPLAAPPRAELEALHALALVGNMRDIRRQAAHLAALDERYRPLAEHLQQLAQDYQSQAILSLIEGCLAGSACQ